MTYYHFNCFGFILCRSFPYLVFPAQRSSFSICCKADLMVLNSFNFFMSVKLLISPSNLNEGLAGQSILGCRFFSHHFSIYHAILFWLVEFLLRNQLMILWEFPFFCCLLFFSCCFNILYLSLIFVSLITVCACSSLGFSCLGLAVLPGLG